MYDCDGQLKDRFNRFLKFGPLTEVLGLNALKSKISKFSTRGFLNASVALHGVTMLSSHIGWTEVGLPLLAL